MTAFYVGVDPASQAAAVAALSESGAIQDYEINCGKQELSKRLRLLRVEVARYVAALDAQGIWCVVVERPAMRFPNTTVIASYGVALEAAAAATRAVVIELSPSQIDQALGLKGGQRKDRNQQFASSLGYDGGSQDVADALVAAAAGRALTQRAVA